MGKVTTNTTDRQSSAVPANVVEVFVMEDFPDPSSGIITLVTNTLYRINAPLTTSDRFLFPAASDIAMETEHPAFAVITYTGTSTLFSSTGGVQRLVMDNVAVVATMAGSTVWSMIGSAATFGIIFLRNLSLLGFTNLGTWTDFPFAIQQGTNYAGFNAGLTTTDVGVSAHTNTGYTSAGTGNGPLLTVQGSNTTRVQIDTVQTFTAALEAILFIDPLIAAAATVDIERVVLTGAGEFFFSDDTGIIIGFSDASFVSESITQVNDNTNASFVFSAPPTLFVGQQITISGFTGAQGTAYNGTHFITATAAGTFEIGVLFAGDQATGAFIGSAMTITDVAHGLSTADVVFIENSQNYNGVASAIFDVVADTFRMNLPFAFVAETPSATTQWNTGSITETDKRMFVFDNGAQKDSMTIGAILVGGNAVATDIVTQNVFVDLNLNALAVESAANERFALTNTTTGEVRYEGKNPKVLNVSGLLAASASGGGQRYNFQALLNGSVLASPDNVNVPVEVGNALTSSPLEWALTMVDGDLFRIQAANADGVTDITIDTLKLVIS